MTRSRNKKRTIIGIAVAAVLIALFGLTLHLIEKHELLDEQFGDTGDWGDDGGEIYLTFDDEDYISTDNVQAYVLAGTDEGGVDNGEGYNGEMADFITVLIIDNTNKKYGFYPISRNTMLDIMVPNKDGDVQDFAFQQLCTAHYYGTTPEQRNEFLMVAVGDALGGLDMSGYFVFSMSDIAAVNDAIGGVDVTVETDMTNRDPSLKKGATVHLTGKQAENFLRARMDVGEGSNDERMARQQQYMENAYSMIISQLRENPDYINDLYEQLQNVVESDVSSRLSRIIAQMSEYENMGFMKFTGHTEHNDTIGEGIIHEEFYVDEQSVLNQMRKVMTIDKDTEADEDSDDEDDEDDDDEEEDEEDDQYDDNATQEEIEAQEL